MVSHSIRRHFIVPVTKLLYSVTSLVSLWHTRKDGDTQDVVKFLPDNQHPLVLDVGTQVNVHMITS